MATQSAVVGLLRVLLSANVADFETAIERADRSLRSWQSDMKRTGRQATELGATLTKVLTVPIAGLGVLSTKLAIDFESSFAGIRKTVDATEAQFADLARGMRDLSKTIPVNVNELNKIGEAAGQLGIKTGNILKFTEVMAKLGATTNLSSEEAAMSLAQLANITQMPQTEFERLGSTIVHLGNNLETNESKIVDFGLRIAAAGELAGMSEHQILSIGAAMASVGVEAEAGGTAVQKVLNSMTEAVALGGKQLEIFAATAGMSAQQFRDAWRADAGAAFAAFVTGLGTQGDNAFRILDGLGVGNERVVRSFLSLANAGDTLTESLRLGADGWRENTALSEEARKRFETTASQLLLLKQRLSDVGVTIGNALLPVLNLAVNAMTLLIPQMETAGRVFAALPFPIQVAAVGVGVLVAATPPLIYLFGQLALTSAALTGAFTKQGLAASGLAAAQSLLGKSMVGILGHLGRVALGFGGVSLAVGVLHQRSREALTQMHANVVQVDEAIQKLERRLEGLRTAQPGGREASVVQGAIANIEADLAALRQVREELTRVGAASQQDPQAIGQLKASVQDLTQQLDAMTRSGQSNAEILRLLGAEAAAATDQAKRLGIDVASLPPAVRDLAAAYQRSTGAATDWAAVLGRTDDAQKKAEERAKAYAAELDRQRQALSSLGVVTQRDVNDAVTEFLTLLDRATEEGVPFNTFVTAASPKLMALAASALKAGADISTLATLIHSLNAAAEEFRPIPPLLETSTDIAGVIGAFDEIDLAQDKARLDAERLAEAYRTMGLTSQDELRRVAFEARQAYEEIAERGEASAETLAAAREKWLDAERRAAGIVASMWPGVFARLVATAKGFYDQASQQLFTTLTGLGVRVDESARKSADEATRAYREMVMTGTASTEELADAYQKMVDAVDRANVTLSERLRAFWESFKEMGFNAINQVFGALAQNLLSGVVNLMRGQQAAFANVLGPLLPGRTAAAAGLGGVPAVSMGAAPGQAAGGGFGAFATSTTGGSLIGGGVGFGVGFGLGRRFGRGAGALSGAGSGALTGGLLGGPIGAGVGAVAGLIGGLIGGSRNNALAGRQQFAEELGFRDQDALFAALEAGGASNADELRHRALNVIGRKDSAANERWMQDVLQAFGEIERKAAELAGKFQELSAATADYGGKAPAHLQPMIASLLESNRLTEEQRALLLTLQGEPGWEAQEAKAKQYGIELAALGPQFQQSKLNDLAVQYAADFQFLREAGADVNGVLLGMKDEVQGVVDTALQFGTTVPENMREMLQRLVEMGELTDENGEKLEDLSRFQFGPKLESPFDKIATILEEIRILLGGEVPAAAEDGATRIQGAFDRLRLKVPVEFDVDDSLGFGTPGFEFDGPEVPGFAGGTGGLMDFGAGTLVRLHGLEEVRTAEQKQADEMARQAVLGGSRSDAAPVTNHYHVTIHAVDSDGITRLVRSSHFQREFTGALRDNPTFRRQTNQGLS